MPRHKEFDPLHALDEAVRVFWLHGYEGAAISMLVEHMGVGRASLYSTYGDKEHLFIKALARYHARVLGPMLEPLFDEGIPGLEAIERVFDSLVDRLTDPDVPRGCLVGVASVDSPRASRDLARAIDDVLADYEAGFYKACRRAHQEGALHAERDPRGAAVMLTNAAQGMCLMGRVETRARTLREIAQVNIDVLKAH